MEILNEKEDQEERIKLMESTYDILKEIKKVLPDNIKLYNIAITYSNKIVEIGQIFKKSSSNNIFIYSLYGMIINYLNDYFEMGIKSLGKYSSYLVDSSKTLSLNMIEESEFLKKYQEVEKKIEDFSIEKDIVSVYEYYKEKDKSNKNDFMSNMYIDKYNNEIEKMGFDVKIPNDDGYGSVDFVDENKIKKSMDFVETIPYKQYDEFTNSFSDEQEKLPKYYAKNKAAIDEKFNGSNIVGWALDEQLLFYFVAATRLDMAKSIEEHNLYVNKLKNFDFEEELVDSIGRHIAYWGDGKQGNELPKLKEDLYKMGRESLYDQIVTNVENHKYDDYVNWKKKEIFGKKESNDISSGRKI